MNDSTAEPTIDVRDVSKIYRRKVHALKGVSLRVMPGEIFGLLGPNGAGKSTLVKILMTIVRPTHAEGTLLGHPIGDGSVLSRVGYLPEHLRFPSYLTGAQALDYYAALGRVPRDVRRQRTAEMLEIVGMTKWQSTRIGTYSKGMKQRIGLAQALMNDPDLVVLDEPTDGVDPVGRHEIRRVLTRLRDQGKAVLINSHLLGELEMVCDRFAILNHGNVVHQGTLEELQAGCDRYEIDVVPALPTDAALEALLRQHNASREQRSGICCLSVPGGTVEVQPVIDALRTAGATIEAVRPIRQTLEDFFIDTVSGDSTPGGTLQ